VCRAARCKICKKTTWAGCGEHVQTVRRSVPAADWCGGTHTEAELQAAQANRPGFFSRLFGR